MTEDPQDSVVAPVADCQAAVGVQPDDPEAHASLARALRRDGEVSAAAKSWFAAACAARRNGDEATFRRHLNSCLKSKPDYHLLFTSQLPPGAKVDDPGEVGAILVAHPDPLVRDDLTRRLRDRRHDVLAVASVDAAVTALTNFRPDLVITAATLGVAAADRAMLVIAACKRVVPDVAVMLLTCAARGEVVADPVALQPLVDEHLDRPLAEERFFAAVHAALWRRRHAARPPQVSPTIEARCRFVPDAIRAGLLVGVGYGVILSAATLLQELSLERLLSQMQRSTAVFGKGFDVSAGTVASDSQTVNYITVNALTPVQPKLDPAQEVGRLPGNTVILAGARFVNTTLEIRDLAGTRIDPVAICGSIAIEVDGHAYPPPSPPRIVDTRLASGPAVSGGRRFSGVTIVVSYPIELVERAGSRLKLLVAETAFQLRPNSIGSSHHEEGEARAPN